MRLLSVVFIVVASLASKGCGRAPMQIGVIAPLTGKFSGIGTAARQGIQMATEEINAKGGIKGRKIQLIIKNSQGADFSEKRWSHSFLGNDDIISIIGPILSQTTADLTPFINSYEGVFISPTVSSDLFSGIKDSFFRVNATTGDRARKLASYLTTQTEFKRIALFSDQANAAYVNSFNKSFISSFLEQGGKIEAKIDFNSEKNPDWTGMLAQRITPHVDAVLINSSAINVATFAQKLRATNEKTQLICSAWSLYRDLIVAGGRAVENIIGISAYDPTNTAPPYLAFKEKHAKRFGGGSMNFSTVHGYEAAHLLFRALKETDGRRKGLHNALINGGPFSGLYSDFELDEFGDVKRDSFLMTVKDGKFVKLSLEK